MTANDATNKLPDWNDETVYQWTFRHTRKQLSRVLAYLVVACIVFPALICSAFWCVSWVSPALAFWLSLGSTGFFVFLCLSVVGRLWFGRRERQHEAAGKSAPVALFAISSLAYALAAPDQFVSTSFKGVDGAGISQWVLFWLDNTFSIVLLDIPQVFQVQLSAISPDGTVSRFATVILRLLVAVGIIEGVIRCYRTTFHDERFHGTLEECYWKCEGLAGEQHVEVLLEGRVQRLPERQAIQASRIIETFKAKAKGTP